jgi:hypothetical protein
MLDRETAAAKFIRDLNGAGREAANRILQEFLEEEDPGPLQSQRVRRIATWYQCLSGDQKRLVMELVDETAAVTIFSLLVYLDGDAGTEWMDEVRPYDYGVFLQVYPDIDARFDGQAEEQVYINPLGAGETLHDLWKSLQDERLAGGETA